MPVVSFLFWNLQLFSRMRLLQLVSLMRDCQFLSHKTVGSLVRSCSFDVLSQIYFFPVFRSITGTRSAVPDCLIWSHCMISSPFSSLIRSYLAYSMLGSFQRHMMLNDCGRSSVDRSKEGHLTSNDADCWAMCASVLVTTNMDKI
jgi:hypothetical protein